MVAVAAAVVVAAAGMQTLAAGARAVENPSSVHHGNLPKTTRTPDLVRTPTLTQARAAGTVEVLLVLAAVAEMVVQLLAAAVVLLVAVAATAVVAVAAQVTAKPNRRSYLAVALHVCRD